MAIYENAEARRRYQRDKARIQARARAYRARKSQGTYFNLEEARLDAYRQILANIPDTVIAYLAGIVDGEGSICLIKSHTQLKHGSGVVYRGNVSIGNTSKALIEFIGRHLGNNWWYSNQKTKPHYKDNFKWARGGTYAWVLCERLLPYLIIKRNKAELLCELYRGGEWFKKRLRSPQELARRDGIWRSFRGLDNC